MSKLYGSSSRQYKGFRNQCLHAWMTGAILLSTGGCGAFNPALLNLFDTSGTGQFITIDNAPGHVVLSIINNASIDERLLDYLDRIQALNSFNALERSNLKPRIRLRLRVTFIDGNFQTIEFITGSANLVDPAFGGIALPDLNQNDLSNAVVLCDVASVALEPGSNIEVFMPVEITQYDLVETNDDQGGITTSFEPRGRIQPLFMNLQVDDLDEDGNVILPRNIGVRDVLSPVNNLLCGSVVAVVINGVVSVPFLEGQSDAPSVDQADEATVARIGGRYEFRLSVQ